MPTRPDVVVCILLAGFVTAIVVASPPPADLSRTSAGWWDLHASGRYGVLYPPTAAVALTGSTTLAATMLAVHLAFTAAGMYLLAKRLGIGPSGGIVAAVAWAMTGFPLSFGGRPWVVFPLAWLPWAVIFADFYKLQPQWKTGTALLILLIIPFYAGDLRTAALVPIAVVLYLGGFLWPGAGLPGAILRSRLKRDLPRAAVMYAAAIAPAVVPALLAGRPEPNEPQVLPTGAWLEFVLPGLESVERDSVPTAVAYGSICLSLWHVPLLYALYGALFARGPMRMPAVILAVTCTGAAVLCAAAGIGWWAPAGLGLLGWAVLAGVGADHLYSAAPEQRRRLIAPAAVGLGLSAVAVVVAAVFWSRRFTPLLGLSTTAGAAAVEDLPHAAAVWAATGSAVVAFYYGLSRRSATAGLATMLLAFGSLGADVFSHARSLLR